MKIKMCDACLAEEIYRKSEYRIRLKGLSKLNVDLCEEHKEDCPDALEEYKDWFSDIRQKGHDFLLTNQPANV